MSIFLRIRNALRRNALRRRGRVVKAGTLMYAVPIEPWQNRYPDFYVRPAEPEEIPIGVALETLKTAEA